MAYILNIETATTNCSVSVAKDGKTIALKEDYDNGYSHAEKLHVYIDEVLKEAQIEKQQLDAIAVSKGPGSYTGLRICVRHSSYCSVYFRSFSTSSKSRKRIDNTYVRCKTIRSVFSNI